MRRPAAPVRWCVTARPSQFDEEYTGSPTIHGPTVGCPGAFVRSLQSGQELHGHVGRALGFHAVKIGARPAVHELADQVDVTLEHARIEDAKQIGMIEPRHQLRFLKQQPAVPCAERRRIDELYRDVDVEEPMTAMKDSPERAGAQHVAHVHARNRHARRPPGIVVRIHGGNCSWPFSLVTRV